MSDPLCSVERITSTGWRSSMRNDRANHFGRRGGKSTVCATRGPVDLSMLEIALLVLLAAAIAYAGLRVVAPEGRIAEETQTVRVAGKQTLWDLASEYRVSGATTAETVEIIKTQNGMTTSALRVGQTLQVPVAQTEMSAMASR